MSRDHLLLALDQNSRALDPLRSAVPLFAAIACHEDRTDPFAGNGGLSDYIRVVAGDVTPVATSQIRLGLCGPPYALAAFPDRGAPAESGAAAYRGFAAVAHRMSDLMRELPDDVRRRLGIDAVFGAPLDDWPWVLFHLAWHFPDHFARGAVRRTRLFRTDHSPAVTSEDWVQLVGVADGLRDAHSGLVFSHFPAELDLVGATGYAIELLRRAVQGGSAFRVTDALRDRLRVLRDEFAAVGEMSARTDGGRPDLELRVLRLDGTFHTPPAARWAGYEPGGAIQEARTLGRLRGVREVVVLRGSSVGDFVTRADRAGALLPAWPDRRDPALLNDVAAWQSRLRRRDELLSEQFYFAAEGGESPAGEPIPGAEIARRYWADTRPNPDFGGLVTDHRGNVERWLGFVLYTLKEHDPDAVEIRNVPADRPDAAHGRNAVLTLRASNVYQASARAMELAGLVWSPPAAVGPPTTGSKRPTPKIRFEDLPDADVYPPPAVGRYVRVRHVERACGEPEWGTGWAWAERPEDGWAECGLCGTGAAAALIGLGRPPAVCDWLPAEWDVAHFPLGGSAEHCAVWRGFVRDVLTGVGDVIPPDDRSYGWRALTRATRQLAHHLGVIPLERLLTPLPATREDARREVEPLLDGLVLVRSRPVVPTAPATTTPVADATAATRVRDVPAWEDTARRLVFRGQECKRFKRPAPDQEKVLAAFQEEARADAIDDPLPSGKLATTVESLNDRLRYIKFSLNGAGTGVCWRAA